MSGRWRILYFTSWILENMSLKDFNVFIWLHRMYFWPCLSVCDHERVLLERPWEHRPLALWREWWTALPQPIISILNFILLIVIFEKKKKKKKTRQYDYVDGGSIVIIEPMGFISLFHWCWAPTAYAYSRYENEYENKQRIFARKHPHDKLSNATHY